MKKLSLLKPNRKTVYLDNGKGQEVDYLYIPKYLDKAALENDVKAGAVQFKDCLDFANKKSSRVVLIDCDNEEEGLMAATYLAGIYNWKDDAYGDMYEEYGDDADAEMPWNAEENSENYKLSDYEAMEELDYSGLFEDNADLNVNGDECAEDDGCWSESPCRMPVIALTKLIDYTNHGISNYSAGPVFMGGQQNAHNRLPYWLTARKEPICITMSAGQGYGGFFFGGTIDEPALVKELRRFEQNRHIYVVMVSDRRENTISFGNWDEDDLCGLDMHQQIVCETVLEYTAGTMKVECDDTGRKKYHQVLFENWAEAFGKKLEKRFPKKEIVEQIVSMRSPDKSALMEKVYRYILSELEDECEVLTKDHFSVLKKFRTMGVISEKKEEQKALQKLDTTLVGLEEVKRQVHSIVEVMKYNKKRAQMGLGNGGYHNVHLLIGAPGTAKTTVAQMMGNIMCEQKLLPDNRFVSINGADLKGMYVGHSAPKTKAYFDQYDIILIDEAYSVATEGEMDSFSQEAIAQLIIELEKHGMDKLVMFAGYGGKHVKESDNKMKQFLNANPGIRSRINSTIYFDSYTPEEMVEIVHCQAKNQKYLLTHEVDEQMRSYFAERAKLPDFGNGREERSLLENITRQAATRIMQIPGEKITKKQLQELNREDVEAALVQMREAYSQQRGQEHRKFGFV